MLYKKTIAVKVTPNKTVAKRWWKTLIAVICRVVRGSFEQRDAEISAVRFVLVTQRCNPAVLQKIQLFEAFQRSVSKASSTDERNRSWIVNFQCPLIGLYILFHLLS